MKITDQDIVRTAQELRDEENEQLHVRHWAKGEKAKRLKAENNTSLSSTTFQLFNFSTFTKWFVATPAAAFIGFVFGIWAQAHTNTGTPLAALVDTVFIEVPAPQQPQQPRPDAVAEVAPNVSRPAQKQDRPRPVSPKASHRRNLAGAVGRPACDDNIRYDLLVCN